METVRKEMEEAASRLGLNHPKVYRLSRELDQLHNEWESVVAKEREKRGMNLFHLRGASSHFRESVDFEIRHVQVI
jgi:hypothetical protein